MPLLYALLNFARGQGRLPRWLFFPLAGLCFLPLGWPTALCVGGGTAAFFSAGWHFDAVTGWYTVHENKVRWITRVSLWLLPPGDTPGWETGRNMARGTVWLALRGAAYSLPLFALLALLHQNPAALFAVPAMLLFGPTYWACGRLRAWLALPFEATRLAEPLSFAYLGALILMSTR